MLKQLVYNGPGEASTFIVAALGLGLVGAEGAMLSVHGHGRTAAVLLAVLLASSASSVAGFAFGALCGAVLFHLMDSRVLAVQVLLVCSIAIQAFSVGTLWRSIDWRSLPGFLTGGFLGVPAGVYLLLHLPSGAYRDTIGVLLIAYGGYQLIAYRGYQMPRWRTRALRLGALGDAYAGFLGGLTGGLAASPGAFVSIRCSFKGWDKARQRGVYQPFILIMQPVALLSIHLMRPTSPTATPLDWKTLAFVPAALLGAWFGLRIFKRLSDRQFGIALNVLLIASGVGLIL
jgi:uncharacterized membrane protein YfcA